MIDAIYILTQEREDILAGKSNSIKWMGRFKKYDDYSELDRAMVIWFIKSIRVISKTKLKIAFNYQNEYNQVATLLEKEAA